MSNLFVHSGAETNLKVGTPVRRKAPGKVFFWSCPSAVFGSTIIRFGERFRDGQYSLVSSVFRLLFFYSRFPPVPSHLYKWGHWGGGTCTMESAPQFGHFPVLFSSSSPTVKSD